MSTSLARPAIPREIWVLVAAAFCVAIGFGLVAPVLPQYARSFDVGVQAASFIISVFALMRLLFAPAGGALVARLGERSVYLAGLLIVAASTGACALAQSYAQLLLFRGLGGIGSTMFTVSAAALVVRIAPPEIRGRVSSAYATAFLIGSIGGPVVGGLVAGLGYRVPFAIYAVTLLAAAGVVAVFLSHASLRPAPGEPVRVVLAVREALRHPAYRAALVAGFVNGWANFGIRVALVPLFAAAVPGMGVAWAGVALTVFAVGNAVALTFAGRAVDRYGRKPFVLGGLIVNGIGTALLGTSHSLVSLLGLSGVAGLGAGLLLPAQHASLADVIGAERNGGKALAAYQMAQDGGTILGPVVAGWVAQQYGYAWAFGVSGALVLVAVAAWLPAPETLVHRDGAGSVARGQGSGGTT